jgi:hypothetical protein
VEGGDAVHEAVEVGHGILRSLVSLKRQRRRSKIGAQEAQRQNTKKHNKGGSGLGQDCENLALPINLVSE